MELSYGISIILGGIIAALGIALIFAGKEMIKKITDTEKDNTSAKKILAWIVLILGILFIVSGLGFAIYTSVLQLMN